MLSKESFLNSRKDLIDVWPASEQLNTADQISKIFWFALAASPRELMKLFLNCSAMAAVDFLRLVSPTATL
jgi:hypothetical protein